MPRRPAGTSVGVPVTDSTHRRRSEGIARCPGGRGSPGQPFPDSICQRHRRLRRRPQPTCGRTFCALRLAQRVSGLPSQVSVSVSVSVSGLRSPGSGLQAPGLGLQAPGLGLQAPGLGLQAPGLGLQAWSSGLEASALRPRACRSQFNLSIADPDPLAAGAARPPLQLPWQRRRRQPGPASVARGAARSDRRQRGAAGN